MEDDNIKSTPTNAKKSRVNKSSSVQVSQLDYKNLRPQNIYLAHRLLKDQIFLRYC